jgi:hypothetical protein
MNTVALIRNCVGTICDLTEIADHCPEYEPWEDARTWGACGIVTDKGTTVGNMETRGLVSNSAPIVRSLEKEDHENWHQSPKCSVTPDGCREHGIQLDYATEPNTRRRRVRGLCQHAKPAVAFKRIRPYQSNRCQILAQAGPLDMGTLVLPD